MTAQELAQEFSRSAEMHRETAKRALEALIRDANDALRRVQDGDMPRTSIGGSVLNDQNFDDAERALVLYGALRTSAALTETVEG